MKCYWSTRAVIAIALILLVVAVLYFVVDSIQARFALSLTTIVAAAMVILIPAKLIGGCSMKTMACQSLTFPAFYVISAVFIISAIVEIAILRKESVENRKQELDDENR